MAIEIRRRPPGPVFDFAPDLHPVLRRVYAARGIAQAEDLDLSLDRLLPVRALDRVERAAELLAAHRLGRVLIVGDFDADGATGSALFVRGLRALKFAHVDFLVPNRFQFGYGLTPGIVALAAERAPSSHRHRGQRRVEHRGRGGCARLRHSGPDHRPSLAGRGAAARRGDRQSQSRGFDVSRAAPSPVSEWRSTWSRHWPTRWGRSNGRPRISWIWSPSARSPIWCRSIAITGSWLHRACGAFVPDAACPASARWSSRPGGGSISSAPRISATSSRRG
jgi:hypothetical protein